MRQHAILSCLVLLLGWGFFFGISLFQAVYAIADWPHKLLFLSVIPSCLLLALLQRQKCNRVVFKANVLGFLGILGLLGIRLYADFKHQADWQLLSTVVMLPFIVLASLGFRAWWAWCFPSIAVLFSYPGLLHFSVYLQTKIAQFMASVLPWPIESPLSMQAGEAQLIPISGFVIHWMVISAFYGYLRYPVFGQRLMFYGLSAVTFLTMVFLQACGLSGLLHWGGHALLSRFNVLQLNQVLSVLGIVFIGYTMSVLAPYKPPMRRMMNDNMDFMILIDRHSHWLALTLVALSLMALSVWLGGNIHQMPMSIMGIWRLAS